MITVLLVGEGTECVRGVGTAKVPCSEGLAFAARLARAPKALIPPEWLNGLIQNAPGVQSPREGFSLLYGLSRYLEGVSVCLL